MEEEVRVLSRRFRLRKWDIGRIFQASPPPPYLRHFPNVAFPANPGPLPYMRPMSHFRKWKRRLTPSEKKVGEGCEPQIEGGGNFVATGTRKTRKEQIEEESLNRKAHDREKEINGAKV